MKYKFTKVNQEKVDGVYKTIDTETKEVDSIFLQNWCSFIPAMRDLGGAEIEEKIVKGKKYTSISPDGQFKGIAVFSPIG